MTNIDKLSVATIRSLCIDMINKANSGHPGMALGSAPILYTLFNYHLVATPENPKWINRDRFVLSAGHASSLLYSLLHLCGYKLSMDDLKEFRQLNSLTPGHPEVNITDGVDATSGPLGQGIAQAVGMALAEKHLNAKYGESVVNHYTYALCGDGCLQEGISQEAISLAGHQKLNKLILFYDSNNVTLDGSLGLSFSEDVETRFKACGWSVICVDDGNDIDTINNAIIKAKKSDKPTLIKVTTVIGFGSQKQGTSKVHGSPLGAEDGKNAKVSYGFDYPEFTVPDEVYENFKANFIARGNKAYKEYDSKVCLDISKLNSDELDSLQFDTVCSTRNASMHALNYFNKKLPNLFGGSADVAGSVMTKIDGALTFSADNPSGNVMNWGIREFAMASAQNGMLLHDGIRTYVGCFAVFSDYMKPAIRMAALSELPAIYLFSHDSIAVGEDGPTHEPIEQLAMLRSIPNLIVIRPADERETFAAWNIALNSKTTPTALILSRQNLPLLDNSKCSGVEKGAYVVSKESNKLDLILVGTGSEVSLCINAKEILEKEGYGIRVVSMPSWELFEAQNDYYKEEILPLCKCHIMSVEMLSDFGWDKYAKHHLSINTFGKSGKAGDVQSYFGFNTDSLVKKCKKIINHE